MQLPLIFLFLPFSLFPPHECLSFSIDEQPTTDSWVDHSSTQHDQTHSTIQTHIQQIYSQRKRSPVPPKLITAIRPLESRNIWKDMHIHLFERHRLWDDSETPSTTAHNLPSFITGPATEQSSVFHLSNLPQAGPISLERRHGLQHVHRRALRSEDDDLGTSNTIIAPSNRNPQATSTISQTPSAPTSVLIAHANKTPLPSLVSSPVKVQNSHTTTNSAQPTGLPNVKDIDSSTPASPATTDSPHSVMGRLGQYYQPSFRLHGLTIAITVAFGLVILLVLISFVKCICHRPKFANIKDYPNGFPWEDPAMASSKGQSRAKPAAQPGKGASPFTNTAEGNWDRLGSGTSTLASGYQLSQLSNSNTPNLPTESYPFPNMAKENPAGWVEFDSGNKGDLLRQAELERTWCSPVIGLSSSSSATDESAQVTPIEGKQDGYQWNLYPRAPGSLYVRGEEDPYMTRAGSYQLNAHQSSELLPAEDHSRNSWSKQNFTAK